MKIVLAADGSRFTTKAVAFVVKLQWMHRAASEIIAVNRLARRADRIGWAGGS